MLIKIIVILLLLAILVSLFTALARLLRGSAGQDKAATARALTLRIGLSILLFLFLMAGFYFGMIPRQGL